MYNKIDFYIPTNYDNLFVLIDVFNYEILFCFVKFLKIDNSNFSFKFSWHNHYHI